MLFSIGFFVGVLFSILVGILDLVTGKLKSLYLIYTVRIRTGEYFATYPYNYSTVEDWMLEEYNELYIVTYAGKKFIKVKLIDSTFNSNRLNKEFTIEKPRFVEGHKRYTGTKAKNNVINEIMGKM